jgi:hypothetical protein
MVRIDVHTAIVLERALSAVIFHTGTTVRQPDPLELILTVSPHPLQRTLDTIQERYQMQRRNDDLRTVRNCLCNLICKCPPFESLLSIDTYAQYIRDLVRRPLYLTEDQFRLLDPELDIAVQEWRTSQIQLPAVLYHTKGRLDEKEEEGDEQKDYHLPSTNPTHFETSPVQDLANKMNMLEFTTTRHIYTRRHAILLRVIQVLYRDTTARLLVYAQDMRTDTSWYRLMLDHFHIPCVEISGSFRLVQKRLKQSREDRHVAILHQNHVSGLDMPWITHVVLLCEEGSSPHNYKQALGRTTRLSRTSRLHVVRLHFD